MTRRPVGFLQVDVDGLWAVRRCYGRHERDSFLADPCWFEGLPRLLRLFESVGSPASLFLVGRDLELPDKARLAREAMQRGFELANHSYSHQIGLTRLPYGAILEELQHCDVLLRRLGVAPVGFRSPGYDVDARVLRAVRAMRYLYDASMLPSYGTPLFRLADAWLSGRWDPEKRQFGRFVYRRAPRRPYYPLPHKIRKSADDLAASRLLEIPVGVTPGWRFPLTATSLFPLSRHALRDLFQRLADARRPVLLLLHAIDGVDCRAPIVFDDKRPRLGGFSLSGKKKERSLVRILEEFDRAFAIERADHYARHVWGLAT